MFCENCKNELKPGELYCSKCGARVTNLNNSNLNNQISNQSSNSSMVNNINSQSNNTSMTSNINNQNASMTNNVNNQSSQQVNNAYVNSSINNGYHAPVKKSKNNGVKIIIAIIALLLIVGAAGYYFIINNKPKNVYRNLVKNLINEVYDVSSLDDDKTSLTFDLGLNVKFDQELLDQSLLDLINKTKLSLNIQMDRNSGQFVTKLDSDYDNESLIDLQLFVDTKNKKTYLYAKDYYDKYIEVEEDDYSSYNEIFEIGKLNFTQKANRNKSKKILIKELISIIKDEDCYKENGNPDSVKENIEDIISNITEGDSNEIIKYSVSKTTLTNKLEKLVVSSGTSEVTFEVNGDKTNYEFKENNETVLNGYVVITKEKNGKKYEILVKIPEVGELTLNFGISNQKVGEIDKADASNSKKLQDISVEDQMKIAENFQNSKLYEIVTIISEIFSGNDSDNDYDYDNDYDTDYDNDYDNNTSTNTTTLSINGYKTINLTIPEGFTSVYESDNYKSYSKDDLSITFRANSYDSADEYLKTLDSKVVYANKDEYYKNVNLSDKKSKLVNNTVYYYKDYTFDYVSKYSNIKYYEKYLCTDLGKNNYLIVEISSKNNQISDNLLNTILSID